MDVFLEPGFPISRRFRQAWRRSLEYFTKLSSTGLREDLVTVNLASAAFAAGRRRGYPVVISKWGASGATWETLGGHQRKLEKDHIIISYKFL